MTGTVGDPPGISEAKTPRKAALASWIGSVMEYYDFFIFGTAAALVFGKVFFPSGNPAAGTLAALATFGVGYIARPLGGIVWGHFGDRLGRKKMLVITLLLMGIATFLIGILPTYEQVGIAAPVLLVALRLLQGFSAGGEQSGANSMTLEHSPAHRRGFYTSFTLSGTQAGLIVSTLAFIPFAQLSDDALMSWGWRVPFLLSAVVVVVGLWVRRSTPETPVFKSVERANAVARLPILVLLRHQGLDVLRVILCALIAVVSTITGVWALSFATEDVGLDNTAMLTVSVLANLVALGALPLWAMLADRIGRRPVFIGGALGSGVLIFAYLGAISSGSYVLIFITGIALIGVVYSAPNGVWPSFYGEMFSARVRYSGMAIGTQIGFAIGGFSPSIAAAIAGGGPDGWLPVALFTAGCAVVAAGCAFTARETAQLPHEELGRPEAAPVAKQAV